MDGALIFGPRAAGSFTEIVGTSGVTEMEGALTSRPLLGAGDSLTEILGMGGDTPIEGMLALYPRPLLGPLTDMEGVSETEMVGTIGAETGCDRIPGPW
jgi:hypothetical protein